jgi:hypothetical protein
MRAGRWLLGLILLAALAAPSQAVAADLPLKPARPAQPAAPAQPAHASPLAAPNAACLEWTDGCRVCQRAANGETSCSNVGIACVPKEEECTRR